MATLTGKDGQMIYEGQTVARVTDYSINFNRDAIEDTCIGGDARTYVKGLFGSTGSATVIVDPDDPGATTMLNTIFESGGKDALQLLLNRDNPTVTAFSFEAFLTSVSPAVRVGDKTVSNVSFQVTGAVSGRF